MKKETVKFLAEVDKLIALGETIISYGSRNNGDTSHEMIAKHTFWVTRTGEILSALYPKNNQYHQSLNSFRQSLHFTNLHSGTAHLLSEIMGVLHAVKYELENGLIENIQKLLQADIFADFLEMGEHLLKEGYKDAAAVIIGSVLEDSLRKLAIFNKIEILNNKGKFLTIEPLNVELAKADVYNQLVKKQITTWADLRNNAAHAHFDQYDAKQVDQMLIFVQTFSSDYLC